MLTAGSETVDPGALIDYGALGLVLLLFILGWLWSKPAIDRVLKDKEKVETQRDALINTYEEQVLPMLKQTAETLIPLVNKNSEVLAAVLDELKNVRRELDGLQDELRELRRQGHA